jgi:hypothetical protein
MDVLVLGNLALCKAGVADTGARQPRPARAVGVA